VSRPFNAASTRPNADGEGPAVAIHALGFRYGRGSPLVLDGLSLEVPRGAIAAILGPNGSGKTTLLHLLLGLYLPSAGSVEVFGHAPEHYSRGALSQLVGLVPQSEILAFELSVLEFVLLGRAPYLGLLDLPHASDRQVAWQALEQTGIASLAGRPVTSLSGGERQLATIARALAQQPRVLLLDEPTSHLDLGNRQRILNILRGLGDQQRTVVFTTHDPNAASAIADTVILVRDGRAVAEGSPHQVFTNDNLFATYGVPVEIVEVRGQPVVVAASPQADPR
jgi:iron complex transport system ATP-binding protein